MAAFAEYDGDWGTVMVVEGTDNGVVDGMPGWRAGRREDLTRDAAVAERNAPVAELRTREMPGRRRRTRRVGCVSCPRSSSSQPVHREASLFSPPLGMPHDWRRATVVTGSHRANVTAASPF